MNQALAVLEKGREFKYPIRSITFGLLVLIFAFSTFISIMMSALASSEGLDYSIFFIPLSCMILTFIFGMLAVKYDESVDYVILVNEKGKRKKVYLEKEE
jgi:hypothetical protein